MSNVDSFGAVAGVLFALYFIISGVAYWDRRSKGWRIIKDNWLWTLMIGLGAWVLIALALGYDFTNMKP